MADTPQRQLSLQADAVTTTEESPRAGSGLSLGRQLLRPRTLLSFAVSIAIIVWVFSRQDISLSDVWAEIRSANPVLYLLGALAYYSSFLVRSLRWRQVLTNAGYTEADGTTLPSTPGIVRIIMLSWFANSILPAKLGDGYRAYLLKRSASVSFSKTMGTIVAERIADVGVLFFLLLLSGFLAFRDRLPPQFGLLVAFGAVLAGVSISSLFFLRYLGPLITRLLPARVRPYYLRLQEGVLLAFRQRIGYIGMLTVLVWLLESARFYFVSASLDIHLSPILVVFVALTASLLTTVPFTPAGLGVVEGGITGVLVFIGQSRVDAGSVAVLDRTVTFWSLLLVGSLLYIFNRNEPVRVAAAYRGNGA